jgi:hypothetical protein
MTSHRLFLIAGLSIGGPGLLAAQPAPADSTAVRRLVQQWWTTADPATYRSLHASEVVSLEPDGQVVTGREALQREFVEDLASFKDYRADSITISTVRFLGVDHAVVQGSFRVVGPRPPVLRYVFLGVLARREGHWQVVAESHTRVGGCC